MENNSRNDSDNTSDKNSQGSGVWSYFNKSNDRNYANCSRCNTLIQCKGGSTSGMRTHLKKKHAIILTVPSVSSENPKGQTSQKSLIDDYFSTKKSLEETISRMVAKDGLTFLVFSTSTDLRRCLIADGYTDLPTAPNTIRKMVMEYSKSVREKMKNEIREALLKGVRFCATFDEWTSSRNRRFLNLILHGKESKIWNLGLVRINGQMKSEKCLDLVAQRLKLFGVTLNTDIVSIMTDGTSVMTKIGKISSTHQQLCFAHGIQLAVVDVLYKKKPKTPQSSADQFSGDETDENNVTEDESDFDLENETDEEEDIDGEADSDDFVIELDSGEITNELEDRYKPTIEKVRKIVRMFRRSPLKNEVLQSYVKMDSYIDNNELSLILDSKTRWNSLADMLARFYKLRICIQKALLDLKPTMKPRKYLSLVLLDDDMFIIRDISNALLPLQVAVEALCRKDANLITADTIFSFTLQKLKNSESELSSKLYDAMYKRINERRTDFSSVLMHLHSGDDETQEIHNIFGRPTRKKCEAVIMSLIKRCHSDEVIQATSETEEDVVIVQSEPSETHSEPPKKRKKMTPLQLELNNAIKKALTQSKPVESRILQSEKNLLKIIRQELNLLENGGTRGLLLNKAYECLLSIKPTSVESEREFLLQGIFAVRFVLE